MVMVWYLSTNNGASWSPVTSGLTDSYINALAVLPGGNPTIFAGTANGIFRSTNNGLSWDTPGLASTTVLALAVIAGDNSEIFASAEKNHPPGPIPLGTLSEDTVSAADSTGVFLSTDNGASWTIVDSGLAILPSCFAVSGGDLFAASEGVFLSTNNGDTWKAVDSGLTNTNIISLAVSNDDVYAGTSGSGVWKRPLSEMITSVTPPSGNIPKSFLLSQNYPNPFNPSTVINYQLPTNGQVALRIFDVLGREVRTLVNERQTAGSHSVIFDGTNLPSGVYFYQLRAGDYAATKKLLLLK